MPNPSAYGRRSLSHARSARLACDPAATETAQYLSKRIVLIDGEQLAKLMIRHDAGCRVEDILQTKKSDEDFFE
jgi:restriction system protein